MALIRISNSEIIIGFGVATVIHQIIDFLIIYTMLTHYVRLTIRSFKRSKCSFFINLTGLTLGISSALLIYLWIADELAVDKFFENDERIFQVMQNIKGETGIQTMEATPGRLAKALIAGLPEVESSASVIPASFNISNGTMSVGDNHVKSAGQYVSEDFLKIFSYKLLDGTKEKALADKKNIVISDKLALKLFKSLKEAVGKPFHGVRRKYKAFILFQQCFSLHQPTPPDSLIFVKL